MTSHLALFLLLILGLAVVGTYLLVFSRDLEAWIKGTRR